jgi:hypothetical protein
MTLILGIDAAWTATVPFDTRRKADEVVSREFGARHYGAHSPTQERPGPQGDDTTAIWCPLG